MLPFVPIIAKQIGISATAVGLAYSLIPIFTFFSNPIIGFLVDYFQNIKVFLVLILITSAISFASIVCLPPIVNKIENITFMQIYSYNDSESPINFSTPFFQSCLEKILKNGVECTLIPEYQTMLRYSNRTRNESLNSVRKFIHNISMLDDTGKSVRNKSFITIHTDIGFLPVMVQDSNSLNFLDCNPDIYECSTNNPSFNSVYSTYQFWAFFCLAIAALVGEITSGTLSSVASYEILGTQEEIYGRQRLFGTIGSAIVGPLAGILNDLQTEKNFLSSIYLMSAFIAIDIIILCIISIPKAHISSNMCKDICSVLSSKDILVFSFGIIFLGILNAIVKVFEFWFLEDMGASQLLLGLSVFMQCLVGEVPFLFFSGWFVKKFGHFLCFAFSFAGFLFRLVLYFLLKNPWLVLPVDVLQGVTFGLSHGTMTSFAKLKAPKGMEATLLGIFGGLYDGLGKWCLVISLYFFFNFR